MYMNKHLLPTLPLLLVIPIVPHFNLRPLVAARLSNAALPVASDIAPPQIKDTEDTPEITVDNENVRYAGQLTPEGLSRLKALTDQKKIKSLTIKSGGGEISIGIDFGDWVFDHQLDVIVEQGCFSSCANYVFPAGRKKTILPGAVVAWHGSALQNSFQTEEGARKEQ